VSGAALARAAGWLLALGLPLALLNALLTLVNPGPGPWPQPSARLSVELCAALLALAGWIAWRGGVSGRALHGLAAVTTVWVLVRNVEITAAALFGRPLHPYWDGRHLGDLLAMNAVPGWQIGAGALAIGAGLALLYRLALACWRRIAGALARRAPRPWIAAASLALLAGFAVPDTHDFFSRPVAPVLARHVQMAAAQLVADGTDARLTPSPAFDGDLAALRGADVLLLFAESYGVTTLDDPAQSAQLAQPRAQLLQALAAGGRRVVSARVQSPTFAGGSWRAHGALLSGVDTRDPLAYDLLLATQRPTLVRHFQAHGYRTVSWMPGLQRPWPEGRFFGFDRYADAQGLGYRGPAFGQWRVPDQASMALLHAQELAAAPQGRAPRFVVFPTVSSHAPFRPLAPYVADWERLLGPQPYSEAQLSHAFDEPVSWREPVPAYLQSVAYTWEWLGAYLGARAPAGLLTLVVGDHQPFAGVSGTGASWDVPVHVITGDEALLQRFEAAGFEPGLEPRGPALGPMHTLAATLLRIFDAS